MRFLLAAVAVLAISGATAQAAPRPIVYVVVVDGLDGDAVDAGQAPFVSSLLTGQDAKATYYPESRSVMITETNPNHTAMMSGAYAGRSGIPSNSFAVYHPTEGEDSCASTGATDESKMPTEVSGENADCPEVEFLFEAVKRQGNPDGLLTAGVFGKPKLGRIFAGENSSKDRRDVDHLWAPCDSGADDDNYCGDVQTNPVTGYAINDKVVMDEVLRTIDEGVGPEKRRPDFTFVNLPQVDSAGHAFGPMPAGPYGAAIGMADDEIARLVGELRARGEWERTVMIVLADHSMGSTLTKTRMSDAFADAGISDDSYLAIGKSAVELIYLADRTSPARFTLLKQMRETALQAEGVTEALYREPNPEDGDAAYTIGAAHPTWQLTGSARVPDLLLTHEPGGSFSDPSASSQPLPGHHGAPQTRDNFFAVIGGGDYVRQQSVPGTAAPMFDDTDANPEQAENVDPAATVMGLFGLSAPRDSEGRFLAEAFELGQLPGRASPAARPRVRVKKRRAPRRRGCQTRKYRALLSPEGTFDVRLRTERNVRRLARATTRRKIRFRVREGHRATIRVRLIAASGAKSKPASKRIDIRGAC